MKLDLSSKFDFKKLINKYVRFNIPSILLSCICAKTSSSSIIYKILPEKDHLERYCYISCVQCNKHIKVNLYFLVNYKNTFYDKCVLV